MNLDSFLGEKRWEILKFIAGKPASPLELSEELSTTVSYISQQLKLLEALGIIYKTKTGSAEKGKPRNVYQISNEFVHLTVLTNDFSEKKILYLSAYHKVMLAIWSISDSTLHKSYSRFFMKLFDFEKELESAYFSKDDEKFYLICSKTVQSKIDDFVKKLSCKVKYSFIEEGKVLPSYIPLLKGELNRT